MNHFFRTVVCEAGEGVKTAWRLHPKRKANSPKRYRIPSAMRIKPSM